MSNRTVSNTDDNKALAENSFRQMTDYLENLLTRQLEKVRNYDLDGAMALAQEANNMAMNIGREKILDRPEFADERRRIHKLYKELGLIIASEREDVADKLRQIRKGMQALETYGDNM